MQLLALGLVVVAALALLAVVAVVGLVGVVVVAVAVGIVVGRASFPIALVRDGGEARHICCLELVDLLLHEPPQKLLGVQWQH